MVGHVTFAHLEPSERGKRSAVVSSSRPLGLCSRQHCLYHGPRLVQKKISRQPPKTAKARISRHAAAMRTALTTPKRPGETHRDCHTSSSFRRLRMVEKEPNDSAAPSISPATSQSPGLEIFHRQSRRIRWQLSRPAVVHGDHTDSSHRVAGVDRVDGAN